MKCVRSLEIVRTHILLSHVKPEVNCIQLAAEDGSTFVATVN